jgi:thiamine biosynthesis lipoprotein
MDEMRRMRPLLGTYVDVWARAPRVDAALDAAFASMAHAQARWSFHDSCSELSRLNSQPQHRVSLDPSTLRLLRAARALMCASEGAFDCTIGGMLVDDGVLPNHQGPAALPRGVAEDIEIGSDWALLRRPVRITLDGIAKGYAVDLALRALRLSGATAGWVNAGGDLRVFGNVALPVQRRELDGRLTSLGSLRNAALASSRSAPRQQPDDESFPGRIVGATGCAPAPGVWSVLARSAWRADALTKVAANVPAAERVQWIRSLGGSLLTASGEPT